MYCKGQPLGFVEVKRVHLNAVEHNKLADHVWSAMKKTTPRDPTWKKWFHKLETNYKQAKEYLHKKWESIKAFFNNAWIIVKRAFGVR